jgi:hypothetical protein
MGTLLIGPVKEIYRKPKYSWKKKSKKYSRHSPEAIEAQTNQSPAHVETSIYSL